MPLTVHRSRSRTVRRGRTTPGSASWRALSVCCLLLAVLFYGAAPLATLWRAADGVRTGDVDALRLALDWHSVREGLKEDMGNAPPLALAGATAAEDELPAFGSSFATTVVSHAIDTEVTPEKLMAMLETPGGDRAGAAWHDALDRIVSLRFSGPARFDAAIRLKNDGGSPLLVSLELRKWRWRITRIHLPADQSQSTRTDRT